MCNRLFVIPLTFAIVFSCLQFHASAQDDENYMPSHDVPVRVNSGPQYNNGDRARVVWTHTIQARNAEWVRLNFSHLILGHDEFSNTSSTLRITSLEDGKFQILNHKSARQWHNTSAYFNGDSVRLELIAFPNGNFNQVSVTNVIAGDVPDGVFERSICGNTDDRQLSTDPRVGRTAPGGCTGWLFNDQKFCMITAGHCGSSTDVMEFNVPLSNSNGSYNHPGPEDQYVVDQSSMQLLNAGVGDDWCYFGCFENSNTGMTALDVQGSSFQLTTPPNVAGDIRITGHGTTSNPVNPMWNGAQKTHAGPFVSDNNDALGYTTDTTGGNSGSPVIYEPTGQAIGVHTHGGCNANGGSNSGTAFSHPDWQNALSSPLGICESGLEFNFPAGLPSSIDPGGGTTARVEIADGGVVPQPGTGMLHFDDGSGFQSISMNQISPNVYDAVFPATNCGSVVNFYFSADDSSGTEFLNPTTAPTTSYVTISASAFTQKFLDDFESDTGWSVTGTATDGVWERGVPAGGGTRGDPAQDADGSGNCYVTDNVSGNSDVDGGATILTSPVMDGSISGNQVALLKYFRWFSNDEGGNVDDVMQIDISNNGGSTWVALETLGPGGGDASGGWIFAMFDISDFVTPTADMRVRFNVSDFGSGSIVEAGVDGVSIDIVECQSTVAFGPDSFTLAQGTLVSGDVGNLADSDNSHLVVRRDLTVVDGITTIEMAGTSPTATPSAIEFVFESSILSRRSANQVIQMFNYNTGAWEQVDARQASRNADQSVNLSLTGDLSRFVEPGTNAIEARVRYLPLVARQQYSTRNDYVQWTITN